MFSISREAVSMKNEMALWLCTGSDSERSNDGRRSSGCSCGNGNSDGGGSEKENLLINHVKGN